MRKILNLFIVLLIFCAMSNAQNKDCKITENGCGKIKIGISQKKIEKILGKPEKEQTVSLKSTDDLLIADFHTKGISIIYLTKTKTVQNIYFYNNDSNEKEFIVFPNANTSKGINWKSTQEDVIKVYGKPKEDFSGTEDNRSWRRIVYPKLDFRFENNVLVRIGVFVKEKKEKVFSI